mmetsp:Transcript_75142/g.202995  ORF Transcript_75142/g.202995 Transcript_75142/m.202995 type:complete len:151 (+) Transcript_75142:72-524(+)
MPSCTTGDLRVWYSVQDPSEVSVVGKILAIPEEHRRIDLYQTAKGHDVGILQAGFKSPEQMMNDEVRRQQWQCLFTRILLGVPAVCLGFYTGDKFKVDYRPVIAGTWGLAIAVMWLIMWGTNRYSLVMLPLSFAGLVYAVKSRKIAPKDS